MPTDPAVEALAEVIDDMDADCQTFATQAEAALDHIAAHLHADTPEGAALRSRLGVDLERGARPFWEVCADQSHNHGNLVRLDGGGPVPRRHISKWSPSVRLTSPWRDA